MISRSAGARARQSIIWVFLAILVIWTLLPFIWSLSTSFKSRVEVYRSPPTLLPREATLDGYRGVFGFPNFYRYVFNSAYLAFGSTVISIVLSVFAAYSFARYRFPARNLLLLLILVPRLLPRVSLVVPLYDTFARIGLLNTYTVLMVSYVSVAVPFTTWILLGFVKNIPISLEESARMDGASLFQILMKIVFPLSVPGIVVASVFSFRQAWNELPFVLAFTTGSKVRTLPYQLFQIKDALGLQDWGVLNAYTVLTIVPIILLYLLFEKRIIRGMMQGAIKS